MTEQERMAWLAARIAAQERIVCWLTVSAVFLFGALLCEATVWWLRWRHG